MNIKQKIKGDKKMPTIQTNLLLGQKSKIFFQEVEFDFTKINPKGIFMVENITEKVKVKPYIVSGNTIVFNAWITKNIAYKVAEDAFIDKNGIATVVGPIRHMTKVIQFGGAIELDLPEGVVLTKEDKAEVLSATVIGSNDELLCKKEITPKHSFEEKEEKEEKGERGESVRRSNCLMGQNQQKGYSNWESSKERDFSRCSERFEPELFEYGKLREKMAIEILVKAVRVAHIDVDEK